MQYSRQQFQSKCLTFIQVEDEQTIGSTVTISALSTLYFKTKKKHLFLSMVTSNKFGVYSYNDQHFLLLCLQPR